jgi:hypothetical protein
MPPALIGGKFIFSLSDIQCLQYNTELRNPGFRNRWNYLMGDLNLLDNDEQFVGSSVDRFGLDRCFQGCCCSHGRLRYLPTE